MATMRPYEDLSEEELQEQIAAISNMGLKPTSPVYSGLTGESDYVSPGGRRGFRTEQPVGDRLANEIRALKKFEESDAARRSGYWKQMGEAEQEYNKSVANSMIMGNQDRMQKELQDIEGRLSGYGPVPRGSKSLYAKWAGADREPTPVDDEGYNSLLRQKYAIMNALAGKGVDIKEAVPEDKTVGGALIAGPGGAVLQQDKTGVVRKVLDREKTYKPDKVQMSYVEKKQVDLAIKILTDPTTDDAKKKEAGNFLKAMERKYGGVLPQLPGDQEPGEEEEEEEAPAPAQKQSAGKGKKIVRTGKDKKTGRKVVQYEDGTMAYAD